ncbi:unnamed protein product, partial [Urochloa humidicola]
PLSLAIFSPPSELRPPAKLVAAAAAPAKPLRPKLHHHLHCLPVVSYLNSGDRAAGDFKSRPSSPLPPPNLTTSPPLQFFSA